MPNVLKNAAGSSGGGGGGEKGNVRKKREGERDDSRKRKRSALEEIREVHKNGPCFTLQCVIHKSQRPLYVGIGQHNSHTFGTPMFQGQ